MKNRFIYVFLSLLLSCGLVLSPCAALSVRASSVAYSPEASLEIMEILYTLLINGMIASGASDIGSLDYDSAMGLFDSFMDSACRSAGLPGTNLELDADAVYMVLDSGTVITWGDLAQSWTDGSGALQLPDEETWQNYSVVQGGAGSSGSPGGNKDFSKVEAIKIGTSFMSAMGAWIYDLASGNVEELNPDAYFNPDISYEGLFNYKKYHFTPDEYRVSADSYHVVGNVIRLGQVNYNGTLRDTVSYYNFDFITDFPVCGYYNNGRFSLWYPSSIKNKLGYGQMYYLDDGKSSNTTISLDVLSSVLQTYKYDGSVEWSFNFPIFSSFDYALDYVNALSADSLTGVLNGEAYDFPTLASSLDVQLAPFAGIYFDPAALPGLSQALNTALAPLPLPDANLAANTEAYKEAVTEAVAVSVPEALPDPVPEPSPEPKPDDGELGKYKIDLRMVFPFCLPFDFIHFLEVLDAEPVTPRFDFPFVVPALGIDMTVDIDLSFMNDIMEIFRIGELVSFVILLISVTPKLIRW